jgi:hypothetical protein
MVQTVFSAERLAETLIAALHSQISDRREPTDGNRRLESDRCQGVSPRIPCGVWHHAGRCRVTPLPWRPAHSAAGRTKSGAHAAKRENKERVINSERRPF